MTSGAVAVASPVVVDDSSLAAEAPPLAPPPLPLPLPLLQPEVALTAGEEDLDEIVALCDDLQTR